MTPPSDQQRVLAPMDDTIPAVLTPLLVPPDDADPSALAVGERADARWFVRTVLTADPTTLRVIIDDRDTRRFLLHMVWSDWQAVPMLAAHVPAILPVGTSRESAAGDLAGALLAALQRDAPGCLDAVGASPDTALIARPGRQERAALRNTRDATTRLDAPRSEKRQR